MKFVLFRGVYTSACALSLRGDLRHELLTKPGVVMILEILWGWRAYVLHLEMDMRNWGTRRQKGRMLQYLSDVLPEGSCGWLGHS